MTTFNHMFDIAFTVTTTKENHEDVTAYELIDALLDRIQYLRKDESELLSSIGFCDTIEL